MQTIYLNKARADAQRVAHFVRQLLKQANAKEDRINLTDVRDFCQNSNVIHAYAYRSLEQEMNDAQWKQEQVFERAFLESDDQEMNPMYDNTCNINCADGFIGACKPVTCSKQNTIDSQVKHPAPQRFNPMPNTKRTHWK